MMSLGLVYENKTETSKLIFRPMDTEIRVGSVCMGYGREHRPRRGFAYKAKQFAQPANCLGTLRENVTIDST